ncbi:MAG: response regulator transcription factor [Beijerinckiaceae bacterium]|nr:response regulator transcription factor [Beijerinckiaceae bacterium]MCI0735036.1 response regulator transcription factor [Beijerinckiaceae bacterium]
MAQESPTRIGAKQIQVVGGLRNFAQSPPCRDHAPHAAGVSLDLTNTAGNGDAERLVAHFGSGGEFAVWPQAIFPVNIAIADKNPMVLRALEALLTRDRRFNLLLMTSNGAQFLSSLAQFPVSLGVIGWELPPLRAPEILQSLARRPAAPKIVVYSGTRNPVAPAETLRLGGAGFVSKLSPPERLLEVFAAVAAGDMVFPFVDIHKARPDPLTSLTHRERDLLAALESGQSNAQLAREFGVSVNTVKFHLRNLFGKLDVRNRTQAICLYLETKR